MKTKLTLHAATGLLALATLTIQPSTGLTQGTAFTYQGRLNAGGAPANGSYDLRFKLFVDPLGNTQAGSAVIANGVAVDNGLFTVPVDCGAGVFNGSSYWLELGVKTNGAGAYVNLSPLQAVTPTPYALFAVNAGNGGFAAGTYTNAVTLNNAANNFSGSFTGNGAGVSNVSALTLHGLEPGGFWQLGGNQVAGGQFIGSTNDQPLEIWANGTRALRLEPNTNGAPNVIGGAPVNFVDPGIVGATIAGGGAVSGDFFLGTGSNHVSAIFGTIAGGRMHTVAADHAFIGGGIQNTVHSFAYDAVIGGGVGNTIHTNAGGTVIAGGYGNNIYAGNGSISGGWENTVGANAYLAAIGGGSGNQANGYAATVSGGSGNQANGVHSTVPGGSANVAAGDNSFAAGNSARANHSGAFVWADAQDADFSSTANNEFSVRAAGGVRLAADVQIGTGSGDYRHVQLGGGNSSGFLYGSYPYFGDGIHLGYNFYADGNGGSHVFNAGGGSSRVTATYGEVVLAVGDVGYGPNQVRLDATLAGVSVYGTFNNFSDRNAKQDFAPVSPSDILNKVVHLPVSEWSYKVDSTTRHVGPMAQDFYAAFNVGTDDRHIAPMDEGGVALAAIQGLNEKVESGKQNAETRIQKLEAENADLKARLEKLEQTFPHWITPVAAAEHDKTLTDDGQIKSLTLPFEFDALVVEAIKEQQQQIKARDSEIAALKQRLDAMEKLMNRLTLAKAGGGQ